MSTQRCTFISLSSRIASLIAWSMETMTLWTGSTLLQMSTFLSSASLTSSKRSSRQAVPCHCLRTLQYWKLSILVYSRSYRACFRMSTSSTTMVEAWSMHKTSRFSACSSLRSSRQSLLECAKVPQSLSQSVLDRRPSLHCKQSQAQPPCRVRKIALSSELMPYCTQKTQRSR